MAGINANGTPNGTGTVDSATLNQLPDWYNQYGQALTGAGLNQLNNVQNYRGAVDAQGNPVPRVAGLSGQQQQASDQVASNQGNYAPMMQAGINTTAQGVDAVTAAGNNYGNANQAVAGGLSTIGAGSDAIAGAARPIAGMEGSLDQATSYLDPARSQVMAGGSTLAGNQGNQAQLQAYMNPYTSQVDNNIATLANQNFNDVTMPGINSTFTGAGQFGSTRNGTFLNNAMRNNQQAISMAQGANDASAVTQAQQAYAAEQARQAQSGQNLGALSQVAQGVAGQYGNEANITSGVGQALASTGAQQIQGANTLASIGNDQTQAGATLGQLGNSQVNQGSQVQQAGINDNNALLTTGGLSQNVQQKGLDAAYQDFIDQRDYPLTALGGLSQILPNVSSKVTPNTQSSSVAQDLPTDPFANVQSLIKGINGTSSVGVPQAGGMNVSTDANGNIIPYTG